MTPVLSIIGKSNSGKTTLIVKIVAILTEKGHRVATVKHDRKHGFDFDKEGKDSWRHKQAGAVTTILSSPKTLALVRDLKEELSLSEIASHYAEDMDILISEGYKEGDHNKIEVAADLPEEELACKKDKCVIALVSDNAFDLHIPQFKRNDATEIAKWIEERIMK